MDRKLIGTDIHVSLFGPEYTAAAEEKAIVHRIRRIAEAIEIHWHNKSPYNSVFDTQPCCHTSAFIFVIVNKIFIGLSQLKTMVEKVSTTHSCSDASSFEKWDETDIPRPQKVGQGD